MTRAGGLAHRALGSARLIRKGATARQVVEHARLQRLPRRTPGESSLISARAPIEYVDAASLASAWETIHLDRVYDLPRSESPRIIDGGANIGVATLRWLARHPAARITAFEPDPSVAAALRSNLAGQDVEIVEAALAASDGTLSFRSDRSDAGRVVEPALGDELRVPGRRLGPWLTERIDLLKLDIEGAELEVLEDIADDLTLVERVFVEYHGFVASDQQLHHLLAILNRAGFRYFPWREFGSARPFMEGAEDQGMDLRVNIAALRSGLLDRR